MRKLKVLVSALSVAISLSSYAKAYAQQAVPEQKDDKSQVIQQYIEDLDQRDGTERTKTIASLVKIGKPAVEPLINAFKEKERVEIVSALCQLKDNKAMPIYLEILKRDIDSAEAVKDKLVLHSKECTVYLMGRDSNGLPTLYSDIRGVAAIALAKLDGKGKKTLIDIMHDNNSDFEIKWRVILACEYLKEPAGQDIINALISYLNDSNERIRLSAALTLGAIGDSKAIQPLKKLLKDSNENISNAAKESINKLKKKK